MKDADGVKRTGRCACTGNPWVAPDGRAFIIECKRSGSRRYWLRRVGLEEYPGWRNVRGFRRLRDALDFRDALCGDLPAASRWYAAHLGDLRAAGIPNAAAEAAKTAARYGFAPAHVNADPETGEVLDASARV